MSERVNISDSMFFFFPVNNLRSRMGCRYAFLFVLHGRANFVTLSDLVIWDSHPLALGATPTQVYIDGISQIDLPYVVEKPNSLQCVPRVPNFDGEAARVVEYEGLPPLLPGESYIGDVLFKNVNSLF